MALLFGLLRNLRVVFALPPAPDQVRPVRHTSAAVHKKDRLQISASMQSSLCAASIAKAAFCSRVC